MQWLSQGFANMTLKEMLLRQKLEFRCLNLWIEKGEGFANMGKESGR
jgi:hypothetical protein